MKKIAVITGASGGIGREFAKSISKHGTYDEVWVIARNREKMESLKKEVPFSVRPMVMDLTDEKTAEEWKERLEKEKPCIRLLINCSGYGKFEYTENISLEENLGMIDLNCKALTTITYLSLPYMEKGSEILNVASVASFQPTPGINVYAATKAYVLAFSRALNRELKAKGIRVFAVCPYWTKTNFFDRAVDEDKEPLIKKYAVMYDPSYVVSYTWKAMKNRNKDYCIPGWIAKGQVFFVKLFPHKWIMSIWQKQQNMTVS